MEMKELIEKLNDATVAYDKGEPYLSDKSWDDLYFQLQKMEEETGIIYPNSPTQSIHFKTVSELKKVEHNHKMLSLPKTKDIKEVEKFLGKEDYVAMAKMDGLTCSLRYLNGKLVSAETRGNGIVGEDILHNIIHAKNVPISIPYKDELIVDGEIICTYEDFEYFSKDYRNPRNFASGSIRLLDSNEAAKRSLSFIAWEIIKGLENDKLTSCFNDLYTFGFKITPFTKLPTVQENIDFIKEAAKIQGYPIDGIVFKFNSRSYGKTLGETAHHFNNAIAYKFYDDTYETTLKDIEWNVGRGDELTPVGIFEPVEIDGTIVERASLHNYSVLMDTLHYPFVGQKIEVAKMNMIIPQIISAEKVSPEEDYPFIQWVPEKCPVCGGHVSIMTSDAASFTVNLTCDNPNCSGKLINKLDYFCGKTGLDIKGLSESTIEKLVNLGWINNYADIFHLETRKNEWKNLSGFGDDSVNNILESIEKSKNCELANFICAIGIPMIGPAQSKIIANKFCDWTAFRNAIKEKYDFSSLENFGEAKNDSIYKYDFTWADNVYKELNVYCNSVPHIDGPLSGKLICITGKLTIYANRYLLIEDIEKHGGKVVDSVSKKTDFLINNDITSTSGKNKKANELNIPIISEEEFIKKYFEGAE